MSIFTIRHTFPPSLLYKNMMQNFRCESSKVQGSIQFFKILSLDTTSPTGLGAYKPWLLAQGNHFPRVRPHKAGSIPGFVPDSCQFCWLCYNTVSSMSKLIHWLSLESHPERCSFILLLRGCCPVHLQHPPTSCTPGQPIRGIHTKRCRVLKQKQMMPTVCAGRSWLCPIPTKKWQVLRLSASTLRLIKVQPQLCPFNLPELGPLCLASEPTAQPGKWGGGSWEWLSVSNQVKYTESP